MDTYLKLVPPGSGQRITVGWDSRLNVPDKPVILFIVGDKTGPEIWAAAAQVLDAAVQRAYDGRRKIEWFEVYAGDKCASIYGKDILLPDDTISAFKEYLIGIKGPLETPVGGGHRSLNVALRQALDLYVCQRPVKWYSGVPSPVKRPELVDMVVFRENTEDLYAGIEWEEGTPNARKVLDFLQRNMGITAIRFPATSSIGIKPISLEGSQRLVHAAIQWALTHKRKSVTLVHKGNIMKYTEGAFMKWGYALAEKQFGDHVYTRRQWAELKAAQGEDAADAEQEAALNSGRLLVKDVIADNFLQQILTHPNEFDVIATTNLNGDYISDALAAQVGGIGIAPGANINYMTGHACFEATHGTASKYAGQDKVNPGSLILSGVMMFEYMGWNEAAHLIEDAMAKAISAGTVTYDFARLCREEGRVDVTEIKCSEFGKAIINNM